MNTVNLVVILLTLVCLITAGDIGSDNLADERKLNRLESIRLSVRTRPKTPTKSSASILKVKTTTSKPTSRPILRTSGKPGNTTALKTVDKIAKQPELRKRPKRHKMNRAMLALLMAYKLKFAAMVPAVIGGFIVLVSTTALAGFFFALFAAALSLKG